MDLVHDADDPIYDIIDYLVRCAKISFKNVHVNEEEARTSDKISSALELYRQSPTNFLLQYGKYMTSHHIEYFDKLHTVYNTQCYRECIIQLKEYHSDGSRSKRIRNRRYKALQKLQQNSDYFSEKQMMHRNPLLYEQLVGQYLTDEEIKQRDCVDRDNLTLLNIILETVDRKHLKEVKNEQLQQENEESNKSRSDKTSRKQYQWGEFETNNTTPRLHEHRKQNMISAPERKLLREEFLQEMCCSFIEGKDTDIDYDTIDNDEQYDDLNQASQDAEDKYFDSEPNEVENLEEHMKLVEEYASTPDENTTNDSLDEFMKHLSKKKQH